MSSVRATRSTMIEATSGARRGYAITIGLAVLFILLQSLTAGEFITDGMPHSAADAWTEVHGFLAYPIMVASLAATVIASLRLTRRRGLIVATGALFLGSVVQWLLGHAITTLGWNWVTPFHVVLAFVIYGLAVWLSVQSAGLRRRPSA